MNLTKLRNQKKAETAYKLYLEGLTLREVAKVIGKSHEWVRQQIKGRISLKRRLDW